jgi:hypothetical protein
MLLIFRIPRFGKALLTEKITGNNATDWDSCPKRHPLGPRNYGKKALTKTFGKLGPFFPINLAKSGAKIILIIKGTFI